MKNKYEETVKALNNILDKKDRLVEIIEHVDEFKKIAVDNKIACPALNKVIEAASINLHLANEMIYENKQLVDMNAERVNRLLRMKGFK